MALPNIGCWAGPDGELGAHVREESQMMLEAYRAKPSLLQEHANQEEDAAKGGYAGRQIFELTQNSADALSNSDGERISMTLTPTHLYCADDGAPIDKDGATALLSSHMSPKRGTDEIGRFGLGFKSVLGVTDKPEFFSRSGSFRFDRDWAARILSEVKPGMERYPVLRLAKPIYPRAAMQANSYLLEMARWANNIVRLPLKGEAHAHLAKQMADFPSEFLLFVEHVGRLELLTDKMDAARVITCDREGEDGLWTLDDGGTKTRWMVTKRLHTLSQTAKDKSRSLDNANEVIIYWAAPVDRLNDPGRFWAFFPTQTTSPLSGILNAPWKTNEDRQNLLLGPYNDELIDAAAAMVADTLPSLSTQDDPARHLDALPRRREVWDTEHANRLRSALYASLKGKPIAPDQTGELIGLRDISYPPAELTPDRGIEWAVRAHFAFGESKWLHHRALTRNRLSRLNALHQEHYASAIPRATIAEWLEAMVEYPTEWARSLNGVDASEICVSASTHAIIIAAMIPESIRKGRHLGEILFTADGRWVAPDPNAVWLSGGYDSDESAVVHPGTEENPNALEALKELGLQPASSTSVFREFAPSLLGRRAENGDDDDWRKFWNLARSADLTAAVEIITSHNNWRDSLRVRTVDGHWRTLFNALLPGRIVPPDGSRDGGIAIDVADFHKEDVAMLKHLGAAEGPRAGHPLSSNHMTGFASRSRDDFTSPERGLPRNPRRHQLNFDESTTSGPLDLLRIWSDGVTIDMSDEAKALYTWEILTLDETYAPWTMRHDTQDVYPPLECTSPAIMCLLGGGLIKTDDGFHSILEAILGDPPASRAALRKLLSHPKADMIRDAFADYGLKADSVDLFEPIGADEPMALTDAWHALEPHLDSEQVNLRLIRCDGVEGVAGADATACVVKDETIYVARRDDEIDELQAILDAGAIDIPYTAKQILEQRTPEDVKNRRNAIRQCATDEERLLKVVGEDRLRVGLPQGLDEILERFQGGGAPLTGLQIAQAAISTFHTGALREYRHALGHLDPPKQWAGRAKAVEFVTSMGFGEEWAGERGVQRDPYIEAEGPYTLLKLHKYQRKVVENVRNLIRSGGVLGERRGMVSMPTGSGKTRVAVQAVVEAIREGEMKKGGVLWVADRDELCEQAVEAWRQVWASEGRQEARLRISRMWAGQPQPLPTADMHVVVASIQTLHARTKDQSASYEFLADFELMVFDEAHRSVAPTFTSVMGELGLTRYRRQSGPLLIGLTATPYRGHDESETLRLVNRYGSNRLDDGAFASDDPQAVIRELQRMKVLAQADHGIIEGGDFYMTDAEKRQSRDNPWLPQSVEDRIARDTARTERIVREYMERVHAVDPDAPALIFATSVEHARTVAALLTSQGVKARAVSGTTDAASRRRAVEEFRAGEVKALVNYAVFREGFDAPKTRAIIVARPVYSPNLYFQMIGRGLRGVKNGGNDRCLILNVQDNIANFGRNLAFSELDDLWDRSM